MSSRIWGRGLSEILHREVIAFIDYDTQLGFNHPPHTADHTHSTSQTLPVNSQGSLRVLSGDPLSGALRILYANRHSQYITAVLSCQVKSFF